jgi:hypothetical protein
MNQISLAVFIPTYDSNVYYGLAKALLGLSADARDRKIHVEIYFFSGDSVIQRVRNACAAKFLHLRMTHMLFVDSDMEFQPKTVWRMLKADEPVVCATYPKKGWRNEKPRGFVPRDLDHMHEALANFAVELDPEVMEGGQKPQIRNGFAKVQSAATGFLLIRRDALDRMIATMPELRYKPDNKYPAPEVAANWYGFFDPMVNPETGAFMAEDTSFSWRWRAKCGGEIWCDLEAQLEHHGSTVFRGNILDTISIRKNASKAAEVAR